MAAVVDYVLQLLGSREPPEELINATPVPQVASALDVRGYLWREANGKWVKRYFEVASPLSNSCMLSFARTHLSIESISFSPSF